MFMDLISSRRRHTSLQGDWSSDVCSSDLPALAGGSKADRWIVSQLSGDARVVHRGVQPASLKVNSALAPGDVVITGEIGRASCRERKRMQDGDRSIEWRHCRKKRSLDRMS